MLVQYALVFCAVAFTGLTTPGAYVIHRYRETLGFARYNCTMLVAAEVSSHGAHGASVGVTVCGGTVCGVAATLVYPPIPGLSAWLDASKSEISRWRSRLPANHTEAPCYFAAVPTNGSVGILEPYDPGYLMLWFVLLVNGCAAGLAFIACLIALSARRGYRRIDP